ncbi:MAG: SMC-Scp complex subunit ScpB, partial [Calditrichaeota bacterium]
EFKGVEMQRVVNHLNEVYETTQRSFRVQLVAGGYQLFTQPQYAEYIERLYSKKQQTRLSTKALETLAIIAYKQPVTRHEIEEIRGVNADGVIKTLLMRNLITIAGTADSPGNPYLYKTTDKFLEYFGLEDISALPRLKELDEIVAADAELKERLDPETLEELAPELLGLKQETDDQKHEQENTPEESE